MLKKYIIAFLICFSFNSCVVLAETSNKMTEPTMNEEPLITDSSKPANIYTNSADNIAIAPTSKERQPVGLLFDRHLSPITGAEAMITTLRAYQLLDDNYFQSTAGDTTGRAIAARIAKLFFIEGIITSTQVIAQHEIFGHGFRAREFHVPGLHYRVTPWNGWIAMNAAKFNQLSQNEKIAIIAGGMEGTSILAGEIRNRWFISPSKTIDSREAQLYITSSLDQTLYILNTKNKRDKTFTMGHDIINYINEINKWYQKPVLNTHTLRRKALLDFLDPYLFYSVYSLGNYIIDGVQEWEYPMIPVGNYQYLPAMRLALAPYGPEYQLINFVKGIEKSYQVTLRYGNTGDRHSLGLGLNVYRLISSELLFVDGKADIWHQPKMFATTALTAKRHFGGAFSVVARYRIAEKIDILGQAGYKTTGYLSGEALKHSPILRIGFAAYL